LVAFYVESKGLLLMGDTGEAFPVIGKGGIIGF
jgi:hypothetical protein